MTIDGQSIPEGTYVAFNLHAVMKHDPLFENPDDFNPARFLIADGKTFRKV